MTFQERRLTADPFEQLVKEQIKRRGYSVSHQGIERLFHSDYPYYEFVQRLADGGNEWAKIERYKPDLFCSHSFKDSFYCEAKMSNKIERNSYEVCRLLEEQGINVILAFQSNSGAIEWIKPSAIRFEVPTPQNNVKGLPCDGVWRQPRRITATWTAEKANAWRYGSGTDFAVVELSNT